MEFTLGGIPKETASKHTETLLGYLNNNVKELVFKHVVVSKRGSETFIWLTLSPESAMLTPRTMKQFVKTQVTLKEHFVGFCKC